MARQHVRVALSGDAVDELFAGYDWYRAQRFASATIDRLPTQLGQRLSTFASHIPPPPQKKGMRDITRRFLEVAILPREMQHTRWQTFWQDDDLAHLLTIPENERSAAVDPRFLPPFPPTGTLPSLYPNHFPHPIRHLPT